MLGDVAIRVGFLIGITLLGWSAGKRLKIDPAGLAVLLVYVISPVVIFVVIQESTAGLAYLSYSAGMWGLSSLSALLAWRFARRFWQDARLNLFSFACGTCNTGYFALPLVMGLLPAEAVGIAVFIILGANLYEYSVGFYLTARAQYSWRTSLKKIATLPMLHATWIGLLVRELDVPINAVVMSGLQGFKGAFSVMGMMVIGLTLARFDRLELDGKFLGLALLWKHVFFPAVSLTLLFTFGAFSVLEKSVITIMLATPMAGNVVVISSLLGVYPQKAALMVVSSTVLTLLTLPLIMGVAL